MTTIAGGLRVSRSDSSGNNSGAKASADATVRRRGERITIPPAGRLLLSSAAPPCRADVVRLHFAAASAPPAANNAPAATTGHQPS